MISLPIEKRGGQFHGLFVHAIMAEELERAADVLSQARLRTAEPIYSIRWMRSRFSS